MGRDAGSRPNPRPNDACWPSSAESERHEFIAQNLQPNTTYFYRLTSSGANNAGFTYWNTFTTRPHVQPPPAVVSLTSPSPSLLTDEDMPVDFTCTADPPAGALLDVIILDAPFGIVWGTFPNFTYLPNPEHEGVDYFDCAYTDGVTLNFARVFVGVRHVEDAPIALDQSVSFVEDAGGKFVVRASGWDFDPWLVDCQIMAGPTNGVVTRGWSPNKLELQYIPNANFSGIDHITFRCFDRDSTGNVATVRIHVSPVNDAPVARPQSVTITSGVPQLIALDASEPDGDMMLFSILTGPAHGTLSGPMPNLIGQYICTPAAGFVGTDTFNWSVSDTAGLSASATVSINVLPPPPPTAPTALTAATGPRTRIDLTWADNSANESGFRIERSLSATSGWTEIATVGPNVRSFAAPSQKPNKTYFFRVRAFNVSGNSAYSNTASAKARN